MANGTIKVEFIDSTLGQTSTQDDVNQVNSNDSLGLGNVNKSQKSIASSSIQTALIQAGKQAVNSSVTMYADLTGNYVAARNINNASSLISVGLMMANFPVGTIVGTTSLALSTASTLIKVRNDNNNSALLRERTGNSALNNSQEFDY